MKCVSRRPLRSHVSFHGVGPDLRAGRGGTTRIRPARRSGPTGHCFPSIVIVKLASKEIVA
jgi:hypothetical protein